VALFFYSAPGAHISARVDQDQARDIAMDFLAQQDVSSVEGMSAIETMNTRSTHFLYLDDRYDDWEGIARGQERLALGNWAFHWEDAGLFDPTGAPNFWVTVDFNGQVVIYRRSGMEDDPETHPEREQALELARQALLAADIDPSVWELEDYSAHRSDDRTDSLLTYAALDEGEDAIPCKITITLHGTTLEGLRIKPGLPDRFVQLVETHERQLALFRGLPRSVIGFVVLLVLAAVFLRRYHQGELGVNRGAVMMLIFLFFYTVVTILILPIIYASTSMSMLNMAQSKLFMTVFMFVFLTIGPPDFHSILRLVGAHRLPLRRRAARHHLPGPLAVLCSSRLPFPPRLQPLGGVVAAPADDDRPAGHRAVRRDLDQASFPCSGPLPLFAAPWPRTADRFAGRIAGLPVLL